MSVLGLHTRSLLTSACSFSYCKQQACGHVRVAEDGEEAFSAEMVTAAAHTIRQLCTDKPDEGKVTFLH